MISQLKIDFIHSIDELQANELHELVNSDYPFIQFEFINALEKSGATTKNSGWEPHHLRITNVGKLVGFIPMYIKSHSYGEYVFDFQWANAYAQSGIDYYPKLLTAIPFTPVTGQRFFLDDSIDNNSTIDLINNLIKKKCTERRMSSWHILFTSDEENNQLSEVNLLSRIGIQYHWFNNEYATFDDFLSFCKTKQRKNIKRERRGVIDQKIQIEMLTGEEISESIWQQFSTFYKMTYLKRSGNYGYLSESFFQHIGEKLGEMIVLGVAKIDKKIIAASLFFKDQNNLYGRYWGCSQEFEFLHFELCYYQGIEYCIKHKLKKFDAGAQGEHKIQRGFTPVKTFSSHLIMEPNFNNAIKDFVTQEAIHIDKVLPDLEKKLPYKLIF